MQLLKYDVECTPQHYALAHSHLLSLWEEIYISLYSYGAMRKGSLHRSRNVTKLSNLFRNLGCKYKILFCALRMSPSLRICWAKPDDGLAVSASLCSRWLASRATPSNLYRRLDKLRPSCGSPRPLPRVICHHKPRLR